MEQILDQVVNNLPLMRVPKNLTSLGFVGILEKAKENFILSLECTLNEMYANDEISFSILKSIVSDSTDINYCQSNQLGAQIEVISKLILNFDVMELEYIFTNREEIEKKWIDKNINHYL